MLLTTTAPVITSSFIWFAFTTVLGLIIWIWKDRRKMQDKKNEKIDTLELTILEKMDKKFQTYEKQNEQKIKDQEEQYIKLMDRAMGTVEDFAETVKEVGGAVKELTKDVVRLQETTSYVAKNLDKNDTSTENLAKDVVRALDKSKAAHRRYDELRQELRDHIADKNIH
jgi:chromosome segregation ATPase